MESLICHFVERERERVLDSYALEGDYFVNNISSMDDDDDDADLESSVMFFRVLHRLR